MTRAVIYARVSTKKAEQQSSIEAQLTACPAFAARHGWQIIAGWDCAEWGFPDTRAFWDRASAFNAQDRRPGWQAVLELCRAGLVDKIIVDKRDRFFRDFDAFRDFKRRFMLDYAVEIVPVMGIRVDPDNPYTEDAEEQEFLEAERFSRRLGRVTRMGRQRRLEAGYWPTFAPAFCKAGAERGLPVWASEEAAAACLQCFRIWAEGGSNAAVRRYLTELGLPPVRGTGWSKTTAARIRANPFYVGEYWKDGRVYELRHGCRVPRELWDAAQEQDYGERRGGRPANGEYIFLLSRVVCSHYRITAPEHRAGEPLPLYARWAVGRGGVKRYYYRRADTMYSTSGISVERADELPDDLRGNVDARELDRAVVELLLSNPALQVDYAADAEQRADEAHREQRAASRARERCRRDVASLESALLKYMLEGQGVSESVRLANQRLTELRERERELTAALGRHERRMAAHEGTRPGEAIAQRVNAIRRLWEAGDYPGLREALALVIDRVDLRLDQPRVYLHPELAVDRQRGRDTARTGLFAYPLAMPRERLLRAA